MLAQSSVSAGRVGVNEVDGGADSGRSSGANKDNELVLQLTVQLAEAINLQDRDLIAQLHETIRCVRQFDNHEYVLHCFQLIIHKCCHTSKVLNSDIKLILNS